MARGGKADLDLDQRLHVRDAGDVVRHALSRLGGNDSVAFCSGQAHGDTVYEFNGNGTAAGDVLRFEGYGTLAEGAPFRQLTATEWRISSANGLHVEIITLAPGSVIDTTTDVLFV